MTSPLANAETRKGAFLSVGASLAVVIMAVAGVLQDNPGEVSAVAALRSLIVFGLIAAAVPFAAFAAGGPFRAVGFAFPIMLLLFFHFPGFLDIAAALQLGKNAGVTAGVIAMIAASAGAVFLYRQNNPEQLAGLVLVATAGAAAASVATVAFNAARSTSDAAGAADVVARLTSAPQIAKKPTGDLPDIIYIVPDRYGSTGQLATGFGVDNRDFYAALKARGFYVTQDARSNYAKTFQSLASTLNMTPLDALFDAVSPDNTDREPFYTMIEDNVAQKTLRSLGYAYVHLGSWWGPTRDNRNADIEFYGLGGAWSALNEFERALLRTTPISWIAFGGGYVDGVECERIKAQLDYLKSVRKRSDRPVFAFAHLTIPHDPITMDKNGNCIAPVYYPGQGVQWSDFQSAFRDYVSYLDGQLLDIIDADKAEDGGRDLIFVIQADEGPYPKRLYEEPDMELYSFDDDETRLKFGVINAIYWNKEKYGEPFLTATPVNNWRIILSKVLGQDIPLEKDERTVLFRDEGHPYQTRDVTDVFTSPSEDARGDLHASIGE